MPRTTNYTGSLAEELPALIESRGFHYHASRQIPADQLEALYRDVILPVHREVVAGIRSDLAEGRI